MKVKELKEYLSKYPDHWEVLFEDVCGNWTFDIYNVEFDEGKVYLVGDEIREEE